ncbi:MAG TPA: hypothetical protein VN442_23530 [Bryobacteraceae bacterium]|nr:hypothetical protein [Bryobacteraceae bacterium]
MTKKTVVAAQAAVVVLLAMTLGCGKTDETAKVTEEKTAAEGKEYQPTGDEGTITGKVAFQGQAPKFPAISMDADAFCASKHSGKVFPDAVVVNDNGTLKNVFVYVKSGLEGKSFAVSDQPAVLDQKGCIYEPHVLGMQAGQNLRVVTSDNTTHNIHPMPKVNREWNVSQPPGADPIVRTFTRPEASIPVKCNQHPWMKAYIHVMGHPFYSVSGQDGAFLLKGLPPGKYEIEAVHEQFGAETRQVTVPPKGSTTSDFAYRVGQAYRPSSLPMMPALVLHCCAEE